MNKCLLCHLRVADKTGSHIIPSFLMKRINGEGERNHEIGFRIKHGTVNTYFGRDIYEEKRKIITDNEEMLYSRENYDIIDHIFCKNCEDFFASLENKYAPSIHLKFSECKNTKVTPSDALLFWCSLVWRASVTEHLGNRLKSDFEERLRIALLTNSIDNLNIHYALFRCKDYSIKTGNGTSVCMDIDDNTVLLFVDEFMLTMFFDMQEEEKGTTLFGIGLTLKKNTLNNGQEIEKIAPLPCDAFSKLIDSIIRAIIKSMQIPEKFKKAHKRIFGEEIPEEILIEILNLVQNTGKCGDKYTTRHYSSCYKEILKKHGLIHEDEDDIQAFL